MFQVLSAVCQQGDYSPDISLTSAQRHIKKHTSALATRVFSQLFDGFDGLKSAYNYLINNRSDSKYYRGIRVPDKAAVPIEMHVWESV